LRYFLDSDAIMVTVERATSLIKKRSIKLNR